MVVYRRTGLYYYISHSEGRKTQLRKVDFKKKFLQFQNSDLIKLEYASGLNILAPSILKTTLGSLLDFQI